jgi:hypothetical protein
MWNKKGRDNKCKGNPQKLPGLLWKHTLK